MKRAGADPDRVRFATLGANLYEPLRLGQVDAGMVQEPALTLITGGGGGVIANMMDIEEANRYLGGPYEFMGVAVRVENASGAATDGPARTRSRRVRDTRTIRRRPWRRYLRAYLVPTGRLARTLNATGNPLSRQRQD
jgi:NitT/TauT family transport system substrate-binding protein